MSSHKPQASILYFIAALFLTNVHSTNDIWSQLNHSVHGRLYAATPLALPCFSNYNGQPVEPDANACSTIQQNYSSSTFRTQFYSGYMNTQDEQCFSDASDQCLLDNSNPFDALAYSNKTCYQGSVSPYYIDVRTAEDIVAAFRFSNTTGIKLVIKNSGHDYLARSSIKRSLALWTRNLRNLARNSSFVPDGCSSGTSYNTITVGAGINFDEVYTYANEKNVTFVGGYANTVGASGGWLLTGGYSVLTPVYGLGIDRVVEIKIVTPDGVLRTANHCQNQDLFWALRGGGGGTFGVVIESTQKVEPQLSLAVASVNFTQTVSNALPFLEIVVNNSVHWGSQGWGGHLMTHNLIYVNPLLSLSQAQSSLRPVTSYALAQNGTAAVEIMTWFQFYTKYVTANQAAIGDTTFIASRLIPTSVFQSESGRTALMTLLTYLVTSGRGVASSVTTPLLHPYAPDSTSATPAWRNSLWQLTVGARPNWNASRTQKREAVAVVTNYTTWLEELAPASGSYANEASAWTADWKASWWGVGNYARLLSVKQRYDPDGLLRCWKCVGFEERAEDGFGCYQGLE